MIRLDVARCAAAAIASADCCRAVSTAYGWRCDALLCGGGVKRRGKLATDDEDGGETKAAEGPDAEATAAVTVSGAMERSAVGGSLLLLAWSTPNFLII